MAKLSALAESMSGTTLDVAGIRWELTEKGDKIAVLKLAQPLEEVVGSQSLTNEEDTTTERLRAFDVDEVKVGVDNQDDDGFDLDPTTGKGTYKGDMRLDVAKRTGETWLVSTSFAAFARMQRNNNTNKNTQGAISKIQERRAALLASKTVGGSTPAANGGETLLSVKPDVNVPAGG